MAQRKHFTVVNMQTGNEFTVGEKAFTEMASKNTQMDLRNASPVYFEKTESNKEGDRWIWTGFQA